MKIIYEFKNVKELHEFMNMNAHASKKKHEQLNNSINNEVVEEAKPLEVDILADYLTKTLERTLLM